MNSPSRTTNKTNPSPTLPAPVPPPQSDFLVSEHEDNDNEDESKPQYQYPEDSTSNIIVNGTDDNDEISKTHSTTGDNGQPTEIPPTSDNDDESDYEYDYEDDEYGQYSGFLVAQPVFGTTTGTSSATIVPQDASSATAHAVGAVARRPSDKNNNVVEADEDLPDADVAGPSSPPANTAITTTSSTWKEPSRQAVSMSLRVEKEKTGGKRRLAADLYRIMTHDTEEAGFSISPSGEDRMDSWTIRLFKFDEDSNLHRDLERLKIDHVELEMNFPDEYPFKPPFVRVVRPRFKRQTGFVMNGALCMELLTNEGWNPINDIESVIVSIRSLLVVGDGRLQAAYDKSSSSTTNSSSQNYGMEEKKKVNAAVAGKRKREDDDDDDGEEEGGKRMLGREVGEYTTAEAKAAYSHLSNFHKKKGWSHWWAKKG